MSRSGEKHAQDYNLILCILMALRATYFLSVIYGDPVQLFLKFITIVQISNLQINEVREDPRLFHDADGSIKGVVTLEILQDAKTRPARRTQEDAGTRTSTPGTWPGGSTPTGRNPGRVDSTGGRKSRMGA